MPNIEPSASFALAKIKKVIYQNILDGLLSPDIILTLAPDGCLLGKEGDLWDFKEMPSGPNNTLEKTILQIVSFYNTYGGYIIYGVKESNGDLFLPVGITQGTFNTKQLRDKLRSYTGESIDATYQEVNIDIKAWNGWLGIMHIPKRPVNSPPVFFSKNGPAIDKKLLFEKDKAYIRIQDNCEPAERKQHLALLYSDRTIDFDDTGKFRLQRDKPLFNNLPERNVICSKFVGRDKIIEQLWLWLGDPLSYTKLLAGDGGKGKSSIAYEFSEEICKVRPYTFEQVFWLSGKRKRFIGHLNIFRDMPEIHFFDLHSLLLALAERLGVLDEDLENTTETHLKKTLKKYLHGLPSFVVIDDVDSLEFDEQKKVMEAVIQISGGESRFLLTTRMNVSYSSSMCITVPGLEPDEYSDLIAVYSERFGIDIPKIKHEKLRIVTDGSPLFTESLVRLIRLGLNIDNAIKQWRGENGDDARHAALKREIEQLSPESCKVLYALSLMSAASATELREVTGYTINKFEQCINELSSLFLLKTITFIETEPRYAVSNNTAILVSQDRASLLTDPKVIENKIKSLRNSAAQKKERGISRLIGMAINQSIALFRAKRGEEALETIQSALKISPNHKDLLFAKARCLMSLSPPHIEEARKTFRLAFKYGQIKSDFFDHWHDAELQAKNPIEIIEVCNLAIKNNASDKLDWELNKAMGYWILAQNHKAGGNSLGALETLADADDILFKVIKDSDGPRKMQAREWSREFHNEIWELGSGYSDRQSTINAFDMTVNAIRHKDDRSIWYDRALKALDWLARSSGETNERWINFLDQNINQILTLAKQNEQSLIRDDMYKPVFERINILKVLTSALRENLLS
ncbi:MAG: putative DNA binding domain-containing protein [Methylococcaceae bacterium]|nr:putative DNA binding domain-containing protein [Methylococcaceae bacterium]